MSSLSSRQIPECQATQALPTQTPHHITLLPAAWSTPNPPRSSPRREPPLPSESGRGALLVPTGRHEDWTRIQIQAG